MLIDCKYGCEDVPGDSISIMDGYPVIIFQIWYNSTFIGFCSLVLKPEVEGCHSVFSQSVQFIFSHVLTNDKLEPF